MTKLWKRENWRQKAKSFAHPASPSVHWCGKCQNINVCPPLGRALSQKVCGGKKSSWISWLSHSVGWRHRENHDGHNTRRKFKLKLASKNICCVLSLWDQMYSDPGEQLMFRLPLEIFLTMSRPAGCSILSHASLPYVYNTVPLNSYNRTHSLIFQLVWLSFLDHYV